MNAPVPDLIDQVTACLDDAARFASRAISVLDLDLHGDHLIASPL
jgi:hypothetical protein